MKDKLEQLLALVGTKNKATEPEKIQIIGLATQLLGEFADDKKEIPEDLLEVLNKTLESRRVTLVGFLIVILMTAKGEM